MAFLSAEGEALKQLNFAKKTIHVGGKKLLVEIADTNEKIARGLMFRKQLLTDNQGMLFIFKQQKMRTFWMKNTFVPLSIGFFDGEKKLLSVAEMQPVISEMEKPKTYKSLKPAKYVLEVNQGWFFRKKVKTGAKLSF